MITILADRDVEGQAFLLWGTLSATEWLELLPMRLVRFADVGLPYDSTDREVWRFAQASQMSLLTNNRCPSGKPACHSKRNPLAQTAHANLQPSSASSIACLYRHSVWAFPELPKRAMGEYCAVRVA
jgi:hypothetical protein